MNLSELLYTNNAKNTVFILLISYPPAYIAAADGAKTRPTEGPQAFVIQKMVLRYFTSFFM